MVVDVKLKIRRAGVLYTRTAFGTASEHLQSTFRVMTTEF